MFHLCFRPCQHFVLAILVALFAGTACAESIKISGVGLSAPLMQRLAEAYRKKQPDVAVTVILPPLGSTGGIRALAGGELDLAISGRLPKLEERAGVGKATELARTAFGFATSNGVRPSGFTTKEVADIYAGRLIHWDGGQPVRLIMRPERETDTSLVRQMSAEVDEAMSVALKRKGLVVAENDLDTIRLIETVPGSFGPTTTGLASLQASHIKFLPLNGVMPSTRALAEGRYPLFKPLYLVAAAHPSKTVERFVAFLQSPQAREIMAAADFVPSSH